MASKPSRPLPPEVTAPLRDVLRGVRAATDMSEDILRPLGGLVPSALRDTLRKAVAAAERAGNEITRYEAPNPDEIAAASAMLESGAGDAAALTRVLSYGLERALGSENARHVMISETVAALALRSALAGGGGRAARAARIVQALSRSHVAGRVPGTGLALDGAERARIDRALVGVMLWLMAERAEYPGDEARILQLSVGLAGALSEEVGAVLADRDALARELDQLAGMI